MPPDSNTPSTSQAQEAVEAQIPELKTYLLDTQKDLHIAPWLVEASTAATLQEQSEKAKQTGQNKLNSARGWLARRRCRRELETIEQRWAYALKAKKDEEAKAEALQSEQARSSTARLLTSAEAASDIAFRAGAGVDTASVLKPSSVSPLTVTSVGAGWNLIDMLLAFAGLADDATRYRAAKTSPKKRRNNLAFGVVGAVAGAALGAVTIAGLVATAPILTILVPGAFALTMVVAAGRSLANLGRSIRKSTLNGLLADRKGSGERLSALYFKDAFNIKSSEEKVKLIDIYLKMDIPLETRGDLERLRRLTLQHEILTRYKTEPVSLTPKEKQLVNTLLNQQRGKVGKNVLDSFIKLGWAAGFTIASIPGLIPIGVLVASAVTAFKVVTAVVSWMHSSYHDWLAKRANEKLEGPLKNQAIENVKARYGDHWQALSPKQQHALIDKAIIQAGKALVGSTVMSRMARWWTSTLASAFKPGPTLADNGKPLTRRQKFINAMKRVGRVFACVLAGPLLLLALPALAIKSAHEKRKQASEKRKQAAKNRVATPVSESSQADESTPLLADQAGPAYLATAATTASPASPRLATDSATAADEQRTGETAGPTQPDSATAAAQQRAPGVYDHSATSTSPQPAEAEADAGAKADAGAPSPPPPGQSQ